MFIHLPIASISCCQYCPMFRKCCSGHTAIIIYWETVWYRHVIIRHITSSGMANEWKSMSPFKGHFSFSVTKLIPPFINLFETFLFEISIPVHFLFICCFCLSLVFLFVCAPREVSVLLAAPDARYEISTGELYSKVHSLSTTYQFINVKVNVFEQSKKPMFVRIEHLCT